MPGDSRPKDGVASLAYVPGIHDLSKAAFRGVNGRDKPGNGNGMDAPASSFQAPA
jgi:hypothetical protein